MNYPILRYLELGRTLADALRISGLSDTNRRVFDYKFLEDTMKQLRQMYDTLKEIMLKYDIMNEVMSVDYYPNGVEEGDYVRDEDMVEFTEKHPSIWTVYERSSEIEMGRLEPAIYISLSHDLTLRIQCDSYPLNYPFWPRLSYCTYARSYYLNLPGSQFESCMRIEQEKQALMAELALSLQYMPGQEAYTQAQRRFQSSTQQFKGSKHIRNIQKLKK